MGDDGELRESVGGDFSFTPSEYIPSVDSSADSDLRSPDSLFTPPSRSESPAGAAFNSPTYSTHGQNGYYTTPGPSSKKSESLIKQTYSTTMTHPITGKVKKFHVVGYSSKVSYFCPITEHAETLQHNPQGDAHNPLPLPRQLPLLTNLKITSGIWPEWDHRRDLDFPARRMTAGLSPRSDPQTGPISAVPSSDRPPSLNVSPPTAYPAPIRPLSPGREQYPSREYGREQAQLTSHDQRHAPAPYIQPYYPQPPYHDPYESQRQFYANRSIPQPPASSYMPQHSQPTQQSNDRYHPYQTSSRSGRPPQYPSNATNPSSALSVPAYFTPPNPYHESGRQRDGREPTPRETQQYFPPNSYPDAYHAYPPYATNDQSSQIHGRYRAGEYYNQNGLPPTPVSSTPSYRDRKRMLEEGYREGIPDGPQSDPRRVSEIRIHARSPSISNLPRHDHLQAPPGISTGRSPKMSIPSALLNPDSVTSGGLTLPPLRLAIDETDRWVPSRGNSPQMGKISPRTASDGVSVGSGEAGKGGEGKGWREDLRQLGELGKMVSL